MAGYEAHETPLRDKYVTPFYRKVLHGNLIRNMEQAQQDVWLTDFCRVAYMLDKPDAHALLAKKNWRPHLVMSWMVGFRDWNEFAPVLEGMLELVTAKARTGVVVGLALLGSPTSTNVLCKHLDVAFSGNIKTSRSWALAALMELDKRNQTIHSEQYLGENGPWEKWKKEEPGRGLAPVAEIVGLLSGLRQDSGIVG